MHFCTGQDPERLVGVTGILALQTLILQLHGDNLKLETVDRESAREVAKEQVQVNKALLDGVNKIGGQVSVIGSKVDELSQDVSTLKASQQAADRRIAGVTAQQQEIQRKIDQQHR